MLDYRSVHGFASSMVGKSKKHSPNVDVSHGRKQEALSRSQKSECQKKQKPLKQERKQASKQAGKIEAHVLLQVFW